MAWGYLIVYSFLLERHKLHVKLFDKFLLVEVLISMLISISVVSAVSPLENIFAHAPNPSNSFWSSSNSFSLCRCG